MKNLIILGSGRSGTSVVAGLFRNTDAHFGNTPLSATISNPKGYYEDHEVNVANNDVIRELLSWPRLDRVRRWFAPKVQLDSRCWWMATPRRIRPVKIPAMALDAMLPHFAQQPFCLKDPRFSTTLAAWKPYLPADTRFVVVYRNPDQTACSMLKDAVAAYSPPLPTRKIDAWTAWYRVYERLLSSWSNEQDWLFVEYGDVLNRSAVPALEAFAETIVDCEELDFGLNRSKGEGAPTSAATSLERQCWELYGKLQACSRRDAARWAVSSLQK